MSEALHRRGGARRRGVGEQSGQQPAGARAVCPDPALLELLRGGRRLGRRLLRGGPRTLRMYKGPVDTRLRSKRMRPKEAFITVRVFLSNNAQE